MAVQIGQLRFTGVNQCVSDLPLVSKYISIPIGGSGSILNGAEDNNSFKDVVLEPSAFGVEQETGSLASFSPNCDYHLQFLINRDLNYDMVFNIKLVSRSNNYENLSQYQFLKQVEIKRGSDGANNTYNVALYEKSDGSIAATIPLECKSDIQTEKDALYIDNQNRYYLGTGLYGEYIPTDKYNDIILSAYWKNQTESNSYGIVDFIFRPVQSGFDAILIEMVRNTIDFNIQENDASGGVTYGRKITNAESMSKKLQFMHNLINNISPIPEQLKHIGIWSHSNLMMAINGEEIHIGQSGFYELDAIPTTSIGIVAKDQSDNWTIDYTY